MQTVQLIPTGFVESPHGGGIGYDIALADGAPVGHASIATLESAPLTPDVPADAMWFEQIVIADGNRESGLGTAAYLEAAKLAQERGKVLTSDPESFSPGAKAVWDALVRKGLAECLQPPTLGADGDYEHGLYRMKK